jgi:hypothetical protein
MIEWIKEHPLLFKFGNSSLYRTDDGNWELERLGVKLNLKVETLKEALEKAEKILVNELFES